MSWRSKGVLEGLLSGAVEVAFRRVAEKCPHRTLDNHGEGVCFYRESSPGDCRWDLCPRLERRLLGGEKNEGEGS